MTFGSSAGQVSVGPNAASLSSRYAPTVNHGSTAGTARVGTAPCRWIGSVDPTNAANDDELYRTDLGALFVRVSGACVEVGRSRYQPLWAIGEAMNAGENTIHRMTDGSGTVALSSGVMFLTAFTATKTETVSQIAMATYYTAAGATPTLAKMAFYSIDSTTGDGTLLGVTANDTSLFASTFTRYTRSFSGGSASKVAGQRYAVGALLVSSAAFPVLHGIQNLQGNMLTEQPWVVRTLASLADVPASFSFTSLGSLGSGILAQVKP